MINATASTETKLASALARVNIFIDAEFDKLAKDLDQTVIDYLERKAPKSIRAIDVGEEIHNLLRNARNRQSGQWTNADLQYFASMQGTGGFGLASAGYGLGGNPHISGQAAQQIPRDTLEMLGLR